jgi:hypothetical protein
MKLGIMTIATHRYIHYFEALIESFLDLYPSANEIQWFLFTDQIHEASRIVEKHKALKIIVIPIPGYQFPEATLYRYEIYNSHRDLLDSEILMHLDADMLIKSKTFLEKISNFTELKKISMVQHPGFYRPKGFQLFHFYLINPTFLARDLLTKLKFGGLGSWERNKTSQAYVSRRNRKTYVCGGIWFGPNAAVKEMIETLAINVKKDESRSIMAKWHDESHLNDFFTKNNIEVYPPELCFDPAYKNLAGLQEIVRAVDKNA